MAAAETSGSPTRKTHFVVSTRGPSASHAVFTADHSRRPSTSTAPPSSFLQRPTADLSGSFVGVGDGEQHSRQEEGEQDDSAVGGGGEYSSDNVTWSDSSCATAATLPSNANSSGFGGGSDRREEQGSAPGRPGDGLPLSPAPPGAAHPIASFTMVRNSRSWAGRWERLPILAQASGTGSRVGGGERGGKGGGGGGKGREPGVVDSTPFGMYHI